MHYNILSELKNATRAKKDKIIFPFTKMDFAILAKLVENGYVKSADSGRALLVLDLFRKRPASN